MVKSDGAAKGREVSPVQAAKGRKPIILLALAGRPVERGFPRSDVRQAAERANSGATLRSNGP